MSKKKKAVKKAVKKKGSVGSLVFGNRAKAYNFYPHTLSILLTSGVAHGVNEAVGNLRDALEEDTSNDDIRDMALSLVEEMEIWFERGHKLRKQFLGKVKKNAKRR